DSSAQTVLPCSQCGRSFAHSDLVQIAGGWVCGECKLGFLNRVMASGAAAASPLGWRYGGFWMRFGARMIDSLLLGVPLLILAALLIPNLLKIQGDASNPAFAGLAAVGLTFFLVYFLVVICY